MDAAGGARGVAHRAFEIAGGGDFEHAEAGVLLVFGAEAAIEGTAAVGLDAHTRRDFAGREKLAAIEPADVGADEILADAVRGAALAEVDAAVAVDDLGGDQCQTLRTQALGCAEVAIVAEVHERSIRPIRLCENDFMTRLKHVESDTAAEKKRDGNDPSRVHARACSPKATSPTGRYRRFRRR